MIHFEKICRTCSFEGELHSLYNKDTLVIADMLTQIVDIKINKEDNFPQNICTICLEKLKSAFNFIKQCQDVNNKLKEYLNNELQNFVECKVDVKEENVSTNNEYDDDFKESYDPCSASEFYIDNEAEENKEPLESPDDDNANKECHVCLQSVPAKTFKRHMRSHRGVGVKNLIECSVCSKRLYKRNYARHMKTHTGERPHLCTFCGQGFIQKVALQSHIRLHTGEKPYQCTYCEKSFKQRSVFLYHIKTKHNDEIKPSPDGKFACKLCRERFSNKKILSAHKLLHNEKSFKSLCNHCGKVFNTPALLKQHIVVHTGETPYECDLCDKSFKRQSDLLHHKRKHSGDKPYKCTVCEKQFWTKMQLDKHILIHTGEKPYKCDVCNQSFRQKTHLKYHNLTHTGEKPHKCTQCDKQFALKSNLKAHIRTHTGEARFMCAVCDKGFNGSYNLKKHMRIHLRTDFETV